MTKVHQTAAGKTVPLRRPWPFPSTAQLPAAVTPAQPPLRPYIVLIGGAPKKRQPPRLRLHVMARSSFEARDRHECLIAEPGERFEVREVRCVDPEGSEADHFFEFVRDWMGDPTIPRGTMDLSGYVCRWCGAEGVETEDGSVVEAEEA